MMKNMPRLFAWALAGSIMAAAANATPSTIITIPSTQTVDKGTVHVDYDTMFTVGQGRDNASMVSLGATYGIADRLEAGFDYLTDTTNPLVGNLKYQVYKQDDVTVAVGAWLLGNPGTTGGNQVYGLASYACDAGRFGVGFASGSKSTFGQDEDQLWLSYDRALGERWWFGADFVSGHSFFGAVNAGLAYSFAENASIIVGFDAYNNNDFDDTVTVQVDVNL